MIIYFPRAMIVVKGGDILSKLTNSFLEFLLEKHKQTGQNSFSFIEYKDFEGYKAAIAELSDRGVIEATKDILGTIIIHRPENK